MTKPKKDDDLPWYAIPKTPGGVVDRIYSLEQQEDELNARSAKLKKERQYLEQHLIDTLPKSDLEGLVGRTATARIQRSVVPTAEDWDAIWKYVTRHKAYDLLQRRLSSQACHERWADSRAIPGVGQFTRVTLSVIKRS